MLASRMILSLCDFSGVWSQPYVDAGYPVMRVDIGYKPGETRIGENLWHVGADLTRMDVSVHPYAVLAAPSCCCFCRPGARWWDRMDSDGKTAEGVLLFRACLRIAQTARGWWALENPPGRHQRLIPELGKSAWQYQPYEYGDPWTKQTYIWGTAKKPPCNPVEPEPLRRTPNGKTQGRIAFLSSTAKREREKTPEGFARVFFEANQ